ncbi:phospholipid carrier-dependent glycosyltransferase [Rhodanobacter sp. T12-5]|uniref:phospholipid carrier-dependent glycosyltransferase n=1 Tax=Rhodanobacter sp. T12-5 TaxID=2024611 RepID=UPI001562291A|nr:phospholipid carrier-dependent glycosyltransferase [Rhodanobacter sp. T12-5]
MQSGNLGARVDRVLEMTVVWVLAASVMGLLTTLFGHFLAPQICIAATLLTGVYAWRVRGGGVPVARVPEWTHLVLLLLVCLFFRLPAFNYVLGGQDEGLYVNIAHYIEHTGGIEVRDTALDKLQGSPFVDRYLSENRHVRASSGPLKGGDFVSGVYIKNPTGDSLSFQFYHLFPVWMALFIGSFGSTFGVYALTFFALLSVLFMYRLALELTDSPRAALIAGLLLAINPLHAFFSKFPVTEVPTLAFSLIGFTYLTRFWSAAPSSRHNRWLLLSMLSFGALFVTRISGFMYIPFFVAMAMAGAVMDQDPVRQRSMQRWVMGVVALYVLSVGYGLHWSHQYSEDIYRSSFERIFPSHWRVELAAVVVIGMLLWWGLTAAVNSGAGRALGKSVMTLARRAIGPIVLVGLVIGTYKVYQLGWTEHFQGDHGLTVVWGLTGSHWRAVRASSLVTLFVYLGPLMPVAFVGWVLRRQDDPRIEFLRFFVAGFFVYIAVLLWVIPYGPYYARYLLSEIVPYMLLFVLVIWSRMPSGYGRHTLSVAMTITLIYSGIVTAGQLGKNESAGLYQSLVKMLSPVDSNDVVLLDVMGPGLPNNSEIKTPIMFTLGLPAVTMSSASLADPSYIAALNARYNDVFVLSPSADTPSGFQLIDSTLIKVWAYQWNHSYPHSIFLRENMNLYLYRLDRPIFPLGHPQGFQAPGAWNQWLASGWSQPESAGVWSNAKYAEIEIDPRALSRIRQGIRLTFRMNGLITAAHPRQRILVKVNGVQVVTRTITYPDSHLLLDVDIPAADLDSTQKIQVAFDLPDAATPKSLGINGDQRLLAIMLESLTASPLDPGGQLSTKPIVPTPIPTKSNPRQR